MSQIDHGVKQETTTVPFPFYIILAKTEINCELQDFLHFQAFVNFVHLSCSHRKINSETYARFNLKLVTTWQSIAAGS
jgi:hypothetical protein